MMQLTKDQTKRVVEVALSYLDHPYIPRKFECVDFVRAVYANIGIIMPKFASYSPPVAFNVEIQVVSDLPIGHPIFLRDKHDPRKRAWTHIGIIFSKNECIHCSLFWGRKVVISSFEEIFERYEFAPSTT